MKIVAVIPARAGSKGIPNKNIRVIGGHPLVYYAIKNAQSSNYITDIVVTTDSPEVEIIAKHMNVKVKKREALLCKDDVTLDSVIADAVFGEKWDYVITMQPTSPTLKYKTLDKAISYAISKELDTLISAVNSPHLSWSIKNGKFVANYKKRLNRQSLPPYYIETGAFVISKGDIVTSETRIGNKVEVFEIPRNESYDIDDFNDLRNVDFALSPQKVAIYVNGNNKRGTGHVYRSLELADEFYVKPDIFYDINQTDSNIFGKTTHTLIPVDGIVELFNKCKINDYTVFINDILDTSIDYMIGLRSVLPNARIINFEDDGEGSIKADAVFNALYPVTNISRFYSGEKYYIANKLFMLYEPIEIKESVKRVFISFGGADPKNYSERLLRIISKSDYSSYSFIVVLGRAQNNANMLIKYNSYPNIKIFHDVSNMPELMTSCDIAVTSRGRTGYELALLGIPTIAMSQNKREEKHSFISSENGFTYIGLDPAEEIIESNLKMYLSMSKESRKHFQELMLSHDLRNGRKYVMEIINSI